MKFIALVFLWFVSWSALANMPDCASHVSGRSLGQILHEFHGGNPHHPTPESLLGRYLAQSGAQSYVQRFSNGSGGFGPEKLVVAVSPHSFELYANLVGRTYPNAFEHLHTPQQGTLMMRWMSQTFSYGRLNGIWRYPRAGSIGPTILLSDAEALRLSDYFKLVQVNNSLAYPTMIRDFNYPRDAYMGNCTTWVGHIPLGDEIKNQIVCPGSIDRWGDQQGSEARHGALTAYPDLPNVDMNLMRRVWNPNLNLRLWELLGIGMEGANHTNPGWVAISLTALANPERVPFVVAYVENHTSVQWPIHPQISPVGP